MDSLLTKDNVLVITRQRRVWKSCIIKDFFNVKNINLEEVFYINKELDVLDKIRDYKNLDYLFQKYIFNHQVEYVVIDKIQDIKRWENFIRARKAEKIFYNNYLK